MGIFYLTVFVNSKGDKFNFESIDPMIDEGDMERGYIRKEDLKAIIEKRSKISPIDGWVIEYTSCSIGGDLTPIESRRLPVY